MRSHCLRVSLSVTLFFVLMAGGPVLADEYRIGPDDLLEINFWQDPTLSAIVRVGQDGTISLDIAGQVEAAGKTTSELQNDIIRQISRLNKRISQAVVRVTEYNYQHVYVIGQVNEPGKKTFEKIPDLWIIINEAGGITETGDLRRVTIVRGGEDAGQVEVVNVARALASGGRERLPEIHRLDAIEVPSMPVGLPSADLSGTVEKRNVFYVIGAVNEPGVIQFEENTDILEAVAMAGGHSDKANLQKVQVVSKDGPYGQSLLFDLRQYSRTGAVARYTLRREDAVIVPQKKSFLGINLGMVATIVGVVASGLLIYDRFVQSDDPVTETTTSGTR